jgi:hypothetical protein
MFFPILIFFLFFQFLFCFCFFWILLICFLGFPFFLHLSRFFSSFLILRISYGLLNIKLGWSLLPISKGGTSHQFLPHRYGRNYWFVFVPFLFAVFI